MKNLVLNDFVGSFTYGNKLKGFGTGKLNNGPNIKLEVDAAKQVKKFKAYSDAAGDVLLKSNIYSSGYGGGIIFELIQQPGKEITGNIQVKNLRVIGAPFLTKLISLTSVEGILEVLGSNGTVFNDIKADYLLNGNFLQIKDGVAVNPSFGITLSGTRDMNKKTINYTGVLSPAYSLNGMVKRIPLIGSILGGDEGEGAFGISYFATGTIDNPKITVNPLSIIAPGQFRNLLN